MIVTQTTQTISINPNNGKTYPIPKTIDDRENIQQFLEKNAGKKVVVVQGLGFVGAVMSIVVANAPGEEYAVIGIDLPTKNSFWKINAINEGEFPIKAEDPKIEEFYQKAREKNNFYATYDPTCYAHADVVIIDINLDVQKESGDWNVLDDYSVNLDNFKKAIQAIGNHCKEDVLILVETTVPPGTCAKIVKPILGNCLRERGLPIDQFKLGHSYERVMPGPNYIDSIQNFYRVYSGVDEKSADATEHFLKTVISTEEYPLTRLGNTNATEMAKVLENSYRAMNIAFMVEWTRFAEEANVNIYEVVKAIRMRPTHKNIMLPGMGVGGYCLTKDPLLASWSKENLFESTSGLGQSEQGVRINDQMPIYAFEFLRKSFNDSLKNKKVLLLGVSYRSDVGDTRYSPVEWFYRCLDRAGCQISLHDPYVDYWEELDLQVNEPLDDLLGQRFDILVISAGHSIYKGKNGFVEKLSRISPSFVYDTIGIWSEEEITTLMDKHRVKVLGRGDL